MYRQVPPDLGSLRLTMGEADTLRRQCNGHPAHPNVKLRSSHLDSVRLLLDELAGDSPSGSFTASILKILKNNAGKTAFYVVAENNLQDPVGNNLQDPLGFLPMFADMDAFHAAAKNGHSGILLKQCMRLVRVNPGNLSSARRDVVFNN